MAVPQYIQGDVNPISAQIATAKAVAKGDIVGEAAGTLVKASDTTWDTNLATTQTAFALLFLGVCMQTKTSTTLARVPGNSVDNKIMVAPEGVYEFDCASASFNVGDYVGPAKQTGNLLEDQKIAAVASAALAIGVVAEKTTSATRVKVKLLSLLMRNRS